MTNKTLESFARDPLHEVLDYCSDKDVLALGCVSQFFKSKVSDRQIWARRAKAANIEFLPDDPLEAKLYYLAIRKIQSRIQNQHIPQSLIDIALKHKDHPFTMRYLVYYFMNNGVTFGKSGRGEIFDPDTAYKIATRLANEFHDIRGILFLVDVCVDGLMLILYDDYVNYIHEWPEKLINLAFKISGHEEPNIPYSEDTRKIFQAISSKYFYKYYQQYSFDEMQKYLNVLSLIKPDEYKPDDCRIQLIDTYSLEDIQNSISFLVAALIPPGRFIDLLLVGSLEEIRDINEEIKADIHQHGYFKVLDRFNNVEELVHCVEYTSINALACNR